MDKKVKSTASWACVINNLNDGKVVRTFYEKSCRRAARENSRLKK